MKKGIEVYCDGGARGNPGPAAWGFVVFRNGQEIVRQKKFIGRATNNVAEYQGVVAALTWLGKLSISNQSLPIMVYLDSQLVTRQLMGEYKIKNRVLQGLAMRVKLLEKKLGTSVSYRSLPRTKNKIADSLVNQALDQALH
jgi:ribonuclease HI